MLKRLFLFTLFMMTVSSISHAMHTDVDPMEGEGGSKVLTIVAVKEKPNQGEGDGSVAASSSQDMTWNRDPDQGSIAQGGGAFMAVLHSNKYPIFDFLSPSQRQRLALTSKGSIAALKEVAGYHVGVAIEPLDKSLRALTKVIGVEEGTTIFASGNLKGNPDYAVHLIPTDVKNNLLARAKDKLILASRKGGRYKILTDIEKGKQDYLEYSFTDLLPTEALGRNTAFLPGLNHKYASYRVFGTAPQVIAFRDALREKLDLLEAAILEEYTPLAETHINTKATYIVIGEDRLAENKAALVAYFSNNPGKTLLIDALQETIRMERHQIPENVPHLAFSNTRHNLTTVEHHFLSECSTLRTVDLSGLSNITTVEHHFLCGCRGLTTLDLSPLSNVTILRGYFLSGCSGLTSIDLFPLSNITTVSYSFLCDSRGLTTLDLSPLSNVTTVGSWFLSGYTGAIPIDPYRLCTM